MGHILLIDAEREFALPTADLLRREGYAVLMEADGRTALDLARGHSPALILLGTELLRMGGLEVLRELQRNGIRTPVVVLSRHDRSPIVAQAMFRGAAAFLRKPVDPNVLLRTVARLTRPLTEAVPA
jgi:DNA-binding response OmpR family regulator